MDDGPTYRTDDGKAEKQFRFELAKCEMPVGFLVENSGRCLDTQSQNPTLKNSNCEQTNTG